MKSLEDIIFRLLYHNPIRKKGVIRWEYEIEEVSNELDDVVRQII